MIIAPSSSRPPIEEPSPLAGMTTRVVKGSLWTLGGQILPLIFSLAATPFVIRMLGAEGYGVLIIVGLISTYFGFADLGMSLASTKFGSDAFAAGDADREARVIRTAAAISLSASVPVAAAIAALSGWLAVLLNVPDHLQLEASHAIKLAALTFVINLLNGIFNTPQLVRLRMDLNTLITAGFRILGICLTPIVIYLGGGIFGAVLVLFVTGLLTLAGHLYVSRRLLPALFGFSIERQAVPALLRFGLALVGAGIAALSLSNLEKFILPGFTTVKSLAYYSVAFTLAAMMTMFANSMIQSLIPAFSQMQGEENRDRLQSLYARGVRLNLILLVPAVVALSIVAKPFFTIWAGEDFGRESVFPFYILLGGLVFNIPAYLPYAAIMASGRTDIFAKLYFAELVPYVFIVLFFTWRFGIYGAATAWSLRIGTDAFLQFFLAKKVTGLSFPRGRFQSFFGAALIMTVPFVLNLYFQTLTVTTVGVFVVCSMIYVFLIWNRVLQDDEHEWITTRFRQLRFT